MKLWTRPDSYAGASWPDWYVFLGQHRDSDLLAQSNFQCGLAAVKPLAVDCVDEDGEESVGVRTVRENHWAVGWVEWIAIHKSNAAAIAEAESIEAALEDHPVVDEYHFSDMEMDAYAKAWSDYGALEFVKELEKYGLVEEDALDLASRDDLMAAFEALIPSGEYQQNGCPQIRYAVERAKRDGLSDEVCALLGLETA